MLFQPKPGAYLLLIGINGPMVTLAIFGGIREVKAKSQGRVLKTNVK